jgi:predicted phage terminase large subunit-like protein
MRSTGPKTARALPVSAQAKGGNIRLVRAWWNELWLNEMCAFPPESDEVKDDQVDATSGAFDYLVSTREGGMVLSAGSDEGESSDDNEDEDEL